MEIARADYPEIRLFLAQEKASSEPLEDLHGHWQKCSPDTLRPLSAVAYFFARELLLTEHVPIVVIGPIGEVRPANRG